MPRFGAAGTENLAIRGEAGEVVRRHRPDYRIALYMGLLMLFGLIVMYAIGPQRANLLNNSYGSDYSDSYFFVKQAVSLAVALVGFAVLAVLPYNWLLKRGAWLLGIGLVACLLLALAGLLHLPIAEQTLGATRWFTFGALGSIQPAEFVKFGMLIYLAVFLANRARAGTVNSWKETLIPVGVVTAISLFFIVVVESDLGTGMALTAIVIVMLFMAGLSRRRGVVLIAAALVLGLILIFSAGNRIDRVVTFLQGDNTSATDPSSYHIEQAKIALGTGGLTGLGIGKSVQATGYLPEATNDSVFAIMGETFGFVGLVVILALLVALLLRLLNVMDHLVDLRLKLAVAGVFGWFAAHVILNIAAIIGIFPLTGITLPLLSFGGTSMVFITAALGFVFQLSRYTSRSMQIKEDYEDTRRRRGIGRTRYASSSGIR